MRSRGRLLAVPLFLLFLALALTSCDTQGASGIGPTHATLNSKGGCVAGASGSWRYQLRPLGGTFTGVGPSVPFSCGTNTAEVALQPYTVTGLTPGTTYQFRIRSVLSDGTALTFDANGANGGTNYDSFRTPRVTSQGEYPAGPEAVCDPPPGEACASAQNHCWNAKRNLPNIDRILFSDVPGFSTILIAKHIVRTDWGYVRLGCGQPNGYIRWRNSTYHFEPHAPVGTAWDGGSYWYSSFCYDNQARCLTRLNARTGYTLPAGAINFHDDDCIATRIGYAGDHHRVVHEVPCSSVAAPGSLSSLAAPQAEALAPNSGLGEAQDQWEQDSTIEDFVGPELDQKIHAACEDAEISIDPECQKALMDAWQTLSESEQRKARELMQDTATRHSNDQ